MFAIQPTKKVQEQGQIRPVVRCVFRRDHDILLLEQPAADGSVGYCLPGGSVGFGEYTWEAIRREIRDELGEEIGSLTFLGPAEQVLTEGGKRTHEIVFLFEGQFLRKHPYHQESLQQGSGPRAQWKPVADLLQGGIRVYPEGLLDLLDDSELLIP
ncbi:MAG: NUDIX domain-containing protein [Bacteroidia bacterium]|nr:NUDIX domain-containing protein [Bacteroidia bacterium]